ncbi:MAG TPA: YbhB/YbcL family Raf kinase inhibitor-like protein [Nitrosospira sp.]|nr:YbhB/YbcL family Raf kinase inhibitor-like protein [Nitrosospira sp.]
MRSIGLSYLQARVAVLSAIALICLVSEAAESNPLRNRQETKQKKEKTFMSMSITSSSFPHNGPIPTRHTCEGHDTSPELLWTDVPAGTKSLALIMDDPDAPDPAAPKRVWVHWVLYNIPATSSGLPEGVAPEDLPPGTQEGLNDWQRTGYGGPCPPIGNHRYFFKLYALDTVLPDLKQPTKAKLEEAMRGHIIAVAELIGRYQKHH